MGLCEVAGVHAIVREGRFYTHDAGLDAVVEVE